MKNTKKILYSLYAAGIVLGAAMLSGCCQTRYVYLNSDGTPAYIPSSCSSGSGLSNFGRALGGICSGIHL